MVKNIGQWILSWPRSRSGGVTLSVVLLTGVAISAVGAGYTVSRTTLDNAVECLPRAHTVSCVNAETGKPESVLPAPDPAKGAERLKSIRLPDGRWAIQNQDTNTVTFIDGATMTPDGKPINLPGANGRLDTLPTPSQTFLVDGKRNVVERIGGDVRRADQIAIDGGINDSVPSGDAVWVLTNSGQIVQIDRDHRVRELGLGKGLRITVANDRPVVVAADGFAYVVDGERPALVGDTGIRPSQDAVLGSWRGAGKYVIGVDQTNRRVVALNPRTQQAFAVELPRELKGTNLGAPVVLGDRVYVPDHSGPHLWKVELFERTAKRLDVPGEPDEFDLRISGGRVWANSQYDQRALIVDSTGADRVIDKGADPNAKDSEGERPSPPDPTSSHGPNDKGTESTPSPQPTHTRGPDGPEDPVPTTHPTLPPGPEETPQVAVPDLRGQEMDAACDRLERLELTCSTVPAGDAEGLNTGQVIGTNPPAGTRVPVGSGVLIRIVGPVQVPDVTGLKHEEACRTLESFGFECARQAGTEPANAPADLLMVSEQNPRPGEGVDKGSTVTVTYPDSVILPSFIGKPIGEACEEIERTYQMKCAQIEGRPAVGSGKAVGAVYVQEPPEGTAAKIGLTVTVTHYSGNNTVNDYTGKTCAEVQADGFVCNPVPGESPAGTGQQPGYAYGQDPPPGTLAPIGSTVTLQQYSDKGRPVPNVTGKDRDTACTEMNLAGYACQDQSELAPNYRTINRQDGTGQVYTIGTPVNIWYSIWQPVHFWIRKEGSSWVLRTDGGQFSVGLAYAQGTALPGHWMRVNEYTCVDTAYCDLGKKMYTRDDSVPGWTTSGEVARFMDCSSAPGAAMIYRVWRGNFPHFDYGITSDRSWGGSAKGSDPLGCVWPG